MAVSGPGAGELFEVKGSVNRAVQLDLKRPTKKGDVVWAHQKVADGSFVATVTIPHLGLTVEGEPRADRKAAEISAGRAALPRLEAMCSAGLGNPKGKGTVMQSPPQNTLQQIGSTPPMGVHVPPPPRAQGTKRTLSQPSMPPSKKSFVQGPPASQAASKTAKESEYAEWREERLITGADPTNENVESVSCWYAQVCLVCLSPVSGLANWSMHAGGKSHRNKYAALGGVQLRPGVPRPNVDLNNLTSMPRQVSMYHQRKAGMSECSAARQDMERFVSVSGFASGSSILSIGEQDYSFSLSVAKLQATAGQSPVQLVASSYLAEHDPYEEEVHVKDDALRAQYTRRSLPSMGGALFSNIAAIKALGGVILHSVDATDLPGTLLTQIPFGNQFGTFDIVVFPFPRFSVDRSVNPGNSKLLRNFFRSVRHAGVLAPGGSVQLLLLSTQFAEWDTACVAAEAGFQLDRYEELPQGFYQSREMTGKAWTPVNGMIYIFKVSERLADDV